MSDRESKTVAGKGDFIWITIARGESNNATFDVFVTMGGPSIEGKASGSDDHLRVELMNCASVIPTAMGLRILTAAYRYLNERRDDFDDYMVRKIGLRQWLRAELSQSDAVAVLDVLELDISNLSWAQNN